MDPKSVRKFRVSVTGLTVSAAVESPNVWVSLPRQVLEMAEIRPGEWAEVRSLTSGIDFRARVRRGDPWRVTVGGVDVAPGDELRLLVGKRSEGVTLCRCERNLVVEIRHATAPVPIEEAWAVGAHGFMD